MDLSVNNRSHKANNISFEGIKSTFDLNNNRILKFFAPPHKKDESVYLQYIKYTYNANDEYYEEEIKTIPFDSSDTAIISNKELENIIKDPNGNSCDGIAYRYVVGDRYLTDGSEKREITICDTDEKAKFNIYKISKNFSATPKEGTMRHSFIDADVPPGYCNALMQYNPSIKDTEATKTDFNFVHNHFNKLGGTLKGIDYLLTRTKELDPYRYIISNPDIGVDSVSSHKYWPENLYQCNNLQTFKDLNFHLYERGKGYVADGAFTSQSIQSPLVQHVCKWGDQSPWFRMLKVENYVNPGVLPDNEKAWNHVGVKIVNNPNDKD